MYYCTREYCFRIIIFNKHPQNLPCVMSIHRAKHSLEKPSNRNIVYLNRLKISAQIQAVFVCTAMYSGLRWPCVQ